MRYYLLPLIAIIFSLFGTSCGDNPILDVNDVTKADLTTPLFLAFDNTLDKPTKKIWAFNETEAVKGTITLEGNNILRVNVDWFFTSWNLANMTLTMDGEIKKYYDIKQVSVLNYSAIAFGTAYVCIPSTNKGINGVRYEDEWFNSGLTRAMFWDALHKAHTQGTSVEIKLNK